MQPVDLDWINNTIRQLLPELILCGTIVLLVIVNLFTSSNRLIFYTAVAGIITHLGIMSFLFSNGDTIRSVSWLIDAVQFYDPITIFKFIISLATLLTVLLSSRENRVEYFILIFSILLGAELLLVTTNFIMILLSMELISLSSYALTAGLHPDKQRSEAAWKFFIYGSVATAVMIFGMSYLYGSSGNVKFGEIPTDTSNALPIIGILMTLGGFLFKMTAAPFHLWAPDVYEATPSPIVALLSVVPKVAAFVLIMKILLIVGIGWSFVIAGIALLTIIIGTLAALNQSNAKRMMAYSSVAQAGFLLIVPASFLPYELSLFRPAIFYVTVFAIMNYVVFVVLHTREQAGKGTNFADFNGIGYTNPYTAIAITLALVSLTGIPPMAGFMAKLSVFTSLWTKISAPSSPIFLALFVVGLLATVASLFFYLKIPFYAFLRRSEEKQSIKISLFTNLLLLILVGLLLTLFVAPGLFDGLGY